MANEAPKTLAIGGEGSGKTFLQLRLSRNEKHLVILDLNEQADLGQGARVVRDKAGFLGAMRDMHRAKSQKKPFRICWHVSAYECPRAALAFTIRALTAMGGAALFLDESESFIPVQNKLTPEAFVLAKRARHISPIPLYMTAHKPMELHNKFRTNLTSIMFFYAEDAGTIEFLRKKKALFHKTADVNKLLKSLGKFEYLLDEKQKPLKKMKKIKNT